MLYQLHEFQRAALEPWRWWAQASAETLGNPLLPFSYAPNAKKVAASLDLMLRITARYERPDFDIQSVDVDGKPVEVTEEVWLDRPFCQLLHFRKARAAKNEPVVLVFAPLSGHFSTLLRDTVKSLLQHHSVVITDWKNARDIPLSEGPFHFDTYVQYVQEFIRTVRARAARPIHAMSVSY